MEGARKKLRERRELEVEEGREGSEGGGGAGMGVGKGGTEERKLTSWGIGTWRRLACSSSFRPVIEENLEEERYAVIVSFSRR